ncbi:MAG: LysM peptidoglycan-binding domain-containing protein [bacterium]|nr:LysM peptidoglycan-binding domain-containing protein [bacterium]
MARKGRKTKATLSDSDSRRKFQRNFYRPRSYMSLLYGVLTVVILFLVIFLGFRTLSQRGVITEEAGKTEEVKQEQLYVVKEGDSLWLIAELKYNDGYKWNEIAKANKIENPDIIEKGTKLTLPLIKKASAEKVETKKISGEKYTVVEGDNLWDISIRAYGDGFKWLEIAKVNNLSNPNLIYPGDVFKLPR